MRLNAPKDILAGLIFIGFGLTTFAMSQHYDIGTALQMGPGYFPAATGIVLACLGGAALIRGASRRTPDPIAAHRLEPLFSVLAAVVVFSLMIDRAGLVLATAALIGIACWRRLLARPLEVLAMYVILVSFTALVFVHWFGMQLRLFWW